MPTGLIYANTFWPYVGGPAEHSHQLAKHLVELGENVTVLTPLNNLNPGDDDFDRACGYNVVRYPTTIGTGRWWRNPLERRRMVTATLRTARRIEADYLVYNGWEPTLIFGLSSATTVRTIGIPTFFFIHGANPRVLSQSRLVNITNRIALGSAAGVICVSRLLPPFLDRFKVRSKRVHVVYSGVDLRETDSYLARRRPDRFPRLDAAIPLDAPNILTLARLNPVKGIDKMIRAMPRILDAVPGARYAIAGTGEDEHRIRRLIAESPARDSITMLGQVTGDEKLECYARCAVFALPSDDEGFPLVFPEAGAFGKPAVGTTVGGIPEVVAHGETGLLLDPR